MKLSILLRSALSISVAAGLLVGCGVKGATPYADNATLGAAPGSWIGCTRRSYDIAADRPFNSQLGMRTTVTISSAGGHVFVSASGENNVTSEIRIRMPGYRAARVARGKPFGLAFAGYGTDIRISQTRDRLSSGALIIRFVECEHWVTRTGRISTLR
jgi:hypothetical protein